MNELRKCEREDCENKTSNSKFCQKCAIRWMAKKHGNYEMDEEPIQLEEASGFIIRRKI